jgi:HEPN domain-containing protein
MSANLSRQWLDRAREDCAVAHLVLREGHTAHACFLAQQCAEKSLKAFLLARSNAFPRTHKLVDLTSECAQLDGGFSPFLPECAVIDQYYVPTRYPDAIPGNLSSGVPSSAEAAEAVGIADRILRFVQDQLV